MRTVLLRQKSSNKWLAVAAGTDKEWREVRPGGNVNIILDHRAFLEDQARHFGIPVADLESWDLADVRQETVSPTLAQGRVPTLPSGTPVCVGVVPAPPAQRTPAQQHRDELMEAIETAVADPLLNIGLRNVLIKIKEVL